MTAARKLLAPLLGSLVFLLCALAVLPYPGIQNDEAYFAGAIYDPENNFYNLGRIPIMVMSYSGALKTWLYQFLWGTLLDPDPWTLRLPMVLAGLATLWLTWHFTRSLAGPKAAAITTALLATDVCFQLTNTFDWGPVALQHLFLMSGLVCILRWLQNPQRLWPVAVGSILWGLGLWDKALLLWPLAALAIATPLCYPRQTLDRLRDRRILLALPCLLLGAAPLVWFNLDRPAATVTSNTHFSFEHAAQKSRVLVTTFDGAALFDYMVRGAYTKEVRQPAGPLEKASVSLAETIGEHRHNWMFWGFLAATAIGFALQTRLTIYLFAICLLTWLQMFLTQDAGRAAHHIILLWPFPLILIGVALAQLPAKPAIALTAILATQNLLTLNEYLAELARFGTTVAWTDAVYPLANSIRPKTTTEVEVTDWGYLTSLQLLLDGAIPVNVATECLTNPNPSPADLEIFRKQLASPKHLFIRHTDGNEIMPGINQKLLEAAARLGYSPQVERTVQDRNGRDIFELFRFERNP